MAKLTIKMGERHYYDVVEDWIKELSETLERRGVEFVKGMGDHYSSGTTYDVLGDIYTADIELFEPTDYNAPLDYYVEQAFGYGVQLAKAGEQALVVPPDPMLGGQHYAKRQALEFAQGYTFNEVRTKDAGLMGAFSQYLLQGLQAGSNPSKAAREAAGALDGDYPNWERIARTETARALNIGLLDESRRLGIDLVYVPHSPTTCPHCERLVDGRVFRRDQLQGATNYGRKQADWQAALPVHPNCTHMPFPASPWVQEQARQAAGGEIPPEGVKINFVPPSER